MERNIVEYVVATYRPDVYVVEIPRWLVNDYVEIDDAGARRRPFFEWGILSL